MNSDSTVGLISLGGCCSRAACGIKLFMLNMPLL